MPQTWLTGNHGFDNQIVDLFLNLNDIVASLFQSLVDLLQASLVTFASSLFCFILFVISRVFVNGVVGQMHKHVIQIRLVWTLIWRSSKPRQSIFKNINFQRINAIK